MGALEMLYQYRRLLAKCESSAGLTLEEIEGFSTLEDILHIPRAVELSARLRSKKFVDPIVVEAVGRAGAVCVGCPYLEEGQTLELRIKSDDHSYRFAVRVAWAREAEDDSYDAGLVFEGAPVLVRNTREFPQLELDRLAAFAA